MGQRKIVKNIERQVETVQYPVVFGLHRRYDGDLKAKEEIVKGLIGKKHLLEHILYVER